MTDKTRAQINRLLGQQPFRPFRLATKGGNRILVERADWFHEVPGQNVWYLTTRPAGGRFAGIPVTSIVSPDDLLDRVDVGA